MKQDDIDFCVRCLKKNNSWEEVKFDLTLGFASNLDIFYSYLSFILLNKDKYNTFVYYFIMLLADPEHFETICALSDKKWLILEISLLVIILNYLILGFLFLFSGHQFISLCWFSIPFFIYKLTKFLKPVREILIKEYLSK